MLTELACRNARPGPKRIKLADAEGLNLFVLTSGSKVWRWKYRFAGKEKQLTIGTWPQTSLRMAREQRDTARIMLNSGIDPALHKKRTKIQAKQEAAESFEAVARMWHQQRAESLSPRYAGQILDRLEKNVFASIGGLPIRQVTAPLVLDLITQVERRGAREMAHRIRMHISDVFVWAIASGIAETDPAALIRKALQPTRGKLRPAVRKIEEARDVLLRTEKLGDIWWSTRLASRLLALTAARPGVIRVAERSEFEDLDGSNPIWRIPAEKMKLTREQKRDASYEFVLPLAHQSVKTVKVAMNASPSASLLFPGVGGWTRPISDSTLSKHYREAGLTGVHVPHGWRATFSTIMNERAATEDRERDRAIIDLMLAHVQDGVEAVYNRALYMPRRRELAQIWADLLMEGMPEPASLVKPAGIIGQS